MAGSRTVKIEILGDAKSARQAFGDVGGAADGFGSKLGSIAKGAGIALAGIGIAAGGMAVVGIRAASDYSESLNKVGEVFDDQAGRIEDWSKNAAQAFGLSQSEALETAGTFGNLFTAMGLSTDVAADMSTDITELAADLGSFNNVGTPEVLDAIRAGLVGETEPLRRFGVNLNAAAIEQKALAMGLADTKGELTPAMKAQAAYALIIEQTTNAQGDFQRTKSGMANSLKVIKASFADLQVEIGQRLLPVIAPLIAALAANMPRALDVAGRMLDWLAGKLRGPLTQAFVLIRDGVLTFIQALQGNWADNENIRGFHRVIGTIALVIREQVIPAVQGMVEFFTGTLLPAVQGVVGFVGQLRDAFGEGGFAGVLATLAERLGPVGEQIITWAAEMYVKFVEQIAGWAGAFVDWIVPMIPPLIVELAKISLAIADWIYTEALPALIEQTAVWGQAFVDWIGPRIGPMLEALGSLLESLGSWLVGTALPAIVAKLAEWGAAFVAWVAPQIPPLLAALGGLLADLGGWMVGTALPAIVAKLAEWGMAFVAWVAKDVLPQLPGALASILSAVGSFIASAAPVIASNLLTWATAFLSWVGSVLAQLPAALGQIIGAVASWVAGAAGAMAAMGADLVRGIIAGIGSMAGAAADALVGVFADAWNKAKDWLQSRSPSKKAAEELGLPVAQGIALGIDQGAGSVNAALLKLANDGLNAAHPQMEIAGREIAQALLKGWQAEGSNKEIWQFESLFNGDVARALIEMKQTAEKNLQLGKIAGEDTTELQAALDDILQLIAQFEDEVDTTILEFMDGADIGAAVAAQWDDLLGNLDGILDGSVQEKLKDTLAGLQRQMQFALAGGAREDVIAAIQANIDAAQKQLATAQQAFQIAEQAGIVPVEEVFKAPIDAIVALLPQMKDGGLSMIDQFVQGVADGSVNMAGAMGAIDAIVAAGTDDLESTIGASSANIMAELEKLDEKFTVDLAEALINGTDPSGIEENLRIINALLNHTKLTAKDTAAAIQGLNPVSGQMIRPPVGGGLSASGGSRQSIKQAAGQVGARAISLYMPSGQLVGEWYAGYQAEQDMLAPVSIGGLV